MMNNIIRVSTELNGVVKIVSGLQKGNLIVVGGRPNMGKTAFAMNIAQNIVSGEGCGLAAVYFSLGRSFDQLSMQWVDMGQGSFNQDIWMKMDTVPGSCDKVHVYVDDSAAISNHEIRSKCRSLRDENGRIDLVVVDYLQLIEGTENTEGREQDILNIIQSLKLLAKELDVPVVILSHLNRSLEDRVDKRPILTDLRELSLIEQDSDVIMFVYRDEFYNNSSDAEGITEIIIAK